VFEIRLRRNAVFATDELFPTLTGELETGRISAEWQQDAGDVQAGREDGRKDQQDKNTGQSL
jgi:hypothetical protein